MYPAKAADVRRVARSLSDDVDALIEELDAARHAVFTGVDRSARQAPDERSRDFGGFEPKGGSA